MSNLLEQTGVAMGAKFLEGILVGNSTPGVGRVAGQHLERE
jgi:hypothetical protein